MKSISQATVDDARLLAGSKIFQRGVEYFAEGRVVSPTVAGNVLRAEVEGSSTSNYNTMVKLEKGRLLCQCDCPYDWGVCKHAVALVLHWVKRKEDFEDVGKKAKDAVRMPREELEKIVKTLASEEPQVFSRIMDLALPEKTASQSGTPDFAKQAERLLEMGADWKDMSAAMRQLKTLRERIKTRLESKKYEYVARQLCRLADACAEHYGGFDDSNGQLSSFVAECLADVEKIWKHVGIEERLGLLVLVWSRAENDDYGFEDDFDAFLVNVCKGSEERQALRKPVIQRLTMLEQMGAKNSKSGTMQYQYERVLELAIALGYMNRKGIYLQN